MDGSADGSREVDECSRQAMLKALGLEPDGSMSAKAQESLEWSCWDKDSVRGGLAGREPKIVRRRAHATVDGAEATRDRRRRLSPLRDALRKARARGGQAWTAAMVEMARVAIGADCPEREAAYLLGVAKVDIDKLPGPAAAKLRSLIEDERRWWVGMEASFGTEGTAKAKELAGAWARLLARSSRG